MVREAAFGGAGDKSERMEGVFPEKMCLSSFMLLCGLGF